MLNLPSKKTLAVIAAIALAATGLLICALMGSQPEINLNGEAVIELSYGEAYVEPGASAVSPGLGTQLEVSISGSVDPFTPGTTEIIYTTEALGRSAQAVRTVIVGQPPSPPAPPPSPSPEPDLAGIELMGDELLEIACGRFYEDAGAVAQGSKGEDMSDKIELSGSVCVWRCGEYVLSYSFEDDKGRVWSAERRVRVIPAEAPEEVATEKVIYLTFDDGPAEYTESILELLDKYEIKASFFVVTSQENIELVREISERGHSIGIHCHMHDYSGKLYSSVEAFFEDFMHAQSIIYELTGEYAAISRFPGGSPTARAYLNSRAEGGFAEVEQILEDMGIRWYDWNVQTEGTDFNASTYLSNFSYAVPRYDTPISLQHDTQYGSYHSLEKMIVWALDNGYSFAPIDSTTPEVHSS